MGRLYWIFLAEDRSGDRPTIPDRPAEGQTYKAEQTCGGTDL